MMSQKIRLRLAAVALSGAWLTAGLPAHAEGPRGLLETLRHHTTLTSTITDNGDLNPYAIAVAPATVGRLQQGDVLVDNFNNITNLQGTGSTIIAYTPSTKKTTLFAKLPQKLAQCPGGVGMTTAMAVLKSGWVIVGSTPSTDGTTRTRGDGCLLVLDAQGQLATAWANPAINGPWGNMAVIDNGSEATLFVSMAGFDLPGPDTLNPATGQPVILTKSTVLRMALSIPAGHVPVITSQTVVADGLSASADKGVFLIGPTGLALGADNTLYVADSLVNRIIAIPDATTRATSAGTGRVVVQDQLMQRPLALAMTAQGHLIAVNGKNGQVVEIDPIAGKQIYASWVDANQAQSPPGNGDLFGIAMRPDGRGFYYVEDEMNFLMEATQ